MVHGRLDVVASRQLRDGGRLDLVLLPIVCSLVCALAAGWNPQGRGAAISAGAESSALARDRLGIADIEGDSGTVLCKIRAHISHGSGDCQLGDAGGLDEITAQISHSLGNFDFSDRLIVGEGIVADTFQTVVKLEAGD